MNLFMGTANDYGQMSPGAAVPYGMIQVCPDSKPRQHPGYDHEVDVISGFSINRLSGVGGSGCGGNVSLLPCTSGSPARIIKSTEQARPGYYAVMMTDGTAFRATATSHLAVEEFTFPQGRVPRLELNTASSFEHVHEAHFRQTAPSEGEGYVMSRNTCGRGHYHLYYRLLTSMPFSIDSVDGGRARITFPQARDSRVEVRILVGTGLKDELHVVPATAIWQKDFTQIEHEAASQWQDLLGRIEVEGGSEEQRTIFYTSLYRTFHSPFQVTDTLMRRYLGTDGAPHQAGQGNYYSSWSLWDTYRTKFPLITLLDPIRSADIMQSLAQLYVTGKRDWSTDYECVPTVRTEHAIATLLDAYRQGISIPNLAEAWSGMVDEAKRLPLKSPDQCLEASVDFWALGQLAQETGRKDEAEWWTHRGEEVFDSIWTKEFMDIDSTYILMRGNGLYQGTRWQYRWGAPMYLGRMEQLVGSRVLLEQLEQFFREELYNQGNEPDIHVPFLFGRLGAPEKTAPVVRSLATETITHRYGGNDAYPQPFVGKAFVNQPRGYCPEMDEDDGAMSAWYVFASIGLYPVVVGEASYEVFPPLFRRVTLYPGGQGHPAVTVRVQGNEDANRPLRRVTWNGRRLRESRISHRMLVQGGELVFHY
ncbi:MAG: glycoside hydrolase domain-containing protein [Bacteroidaceae bacterium]